jgi:CHAT domain-containing protein
MADAGSNIAPGFLEKLLAAPTREQQTALLHAAQLLNSAGIAELLDIAAQRVRGDPGQGRRLAQLCLAVADRSSASALKPRALYLCAQSHAANAEFETALDLIEQAWRAYSAQGDELDALRTSVGRMGVLIDLGRYQEALATAQATLQALSAIGDDTSDPLSPTELIAALAYQNIGVCYEQMGRYDPALDAYAEAERRFHALGMPDRIGDIANNRGVVLLSLGRGGEALAAFGSSAARFAEADLTLLQAQTLMNIGDALMQLGSYARGLAAFQQARQLFEALDALAEQHQLLLDIADAYLALNLYPEAHAAYRDLDTTLASAGMPHARARALRGMGAALLALEHLDTARQVLAEAAVLCANAGNTSMLSEVVVEQAALDAAGGDRTGAVATARRALALATTGGSPVHQVYAHLRLADLLLPDLPAAEEILLAARPIAASIGLPHLQYRLNQRLGHLRLLQGRDTEAAALLEAAVDTIERLRGTLAHEAMRTSFLRDNVNAYEDLVWLALKQPDGAHKAFAAAERAKSRTLVDLMTGVVAPSSAQAASQLVAERARTLQSDLLGIYNELFSGASGEQPHQHHDILRSRALELESEISRLRLQYSPAALGTAPVAPAGHEILATLPADLVVVAYHVIGEDVVAFVWVGGVLHATEVLTTTRAVHQLLGRLAVQWQRLQVGQTLLGQHMSLLEQSAQRTLEALYHALFARLEPLIGAAAPRSGEPIKLAVVPHGPLHQVAFHALFDGQRYLIERFEISYAPSVTVLSLCQQRRLPHHGRALVLGVSDRLIPAVAQECRAVAGQLAGAELALDEQATGQQLRARAAGCDVVHLACHGLFRGDNPMFSALKMGDGWLTATDINELDLTDALVTLSACESGRSTVIGGDETLGLARAVLGAGAATLVVSLWLVHDATTAELMATWYARLCAGDTPAAALRAAQIATMRQRRHPYYWAPFMLIGRR